MGYRFLLLTVILLLNSLNGFCGGIAGSITNYYLANCSGKDLYYQIKFKNIDNFSYREINESDLLLNPLQEGEQKNKIIYNFNKNQIYQPVDYYFSEWNNIVNLFGIVNHEDDEINLIDFFQYVIEKLNIYDANGKLLYSINDLTKFQSSMSRSESLDGWFTLNYFFIITPDKIGASNAFPYIAADNLRIRISPSRNAETITVINKGEQMKILGIGKKEDMSVEDIHWNTGKKDLNVYKCWVEIETVKGTRGWCYSYYIKP